MNLFVKKLSETAVIPAHQTADAAGMDICSDRIQFIRPNGAIMALTGIAVEIPKHHFGLIRLRSGFASRNKLVLITSGVVDSDYRGELKVPICNLSGNEIVIGAGERFAQMVIIPCPPISVIEVNELEKSDRGEGGFGSTGAFAPHHTNVKTCVCGGSGTIGTMFPVNCPCCRPDPEVLKTVTEDHIRE